jgi:acyl carrier protein
MDSQIRAQKIAAWMQEYAANLLKVPVSSVSTTDSFDTLGLDSASAVALIGDLEDWLQFELSPSLAYDYPTIEKLALALVSLKSGNTAAPA